MKNLHWGDRETLEWLRYLLRQTPSAPLLVVGTARPEAVSPDHPLVALTTELYHSGQLREIALGPLDAAETAALGAQVVGHPLDTQQAERLYRETRGQPLYVVELLRAGLLDWPVALSDTDGVPGVGRGAGKRRFLPRMQAVLDERLRQLSPLARELADLASVVGRAFSFALLVQARKGARPSRRSRGSSRFARDDEDGVTQGLKELLHRHILVEQGASDFDFSHDKLREAASAALSSVRRQALHLRVARALEVVAADDLDAVCTHLAVHYEQGGEPERASRYLERAGLLAIGRGALLQARGYLQRAVALAPSAALVRAYEQLGDSYWLSEGAFSAYSTALQHWREQTDKQADGPADPVVGAPPAAQAGVRLVSVRIRRYAERCGGDGTGCGGRTAGGAS